MACLCRIVYTISILVSFCKEKFGWFPLTIWRNAVVHLKAIMGVLKLPNCPDPECVIESLKFLESLMLSGSLLKKICHGKPLFMIKWQGYCSSQNTWEPKTHLPPELIKAFKNPDPDPVRMEETRERIGLVLKEGWKFLFNTKNRSRLAMMWFASFSQAFQWRSRQHQPILGTRSLTTLAQ